MAGGELTIFMHGSRFRVVCSPIIYWPVPLLWFWRRTQWEAYMWEDNPRERKPLSHRTRPYIRKQDAVDECLRMINAEQYIRIM